MASVIAAISSRELNGDWTLESQSYFRRSSAKKSNCVNTRYRASTMLKTPNNPNNLRVIYLGIEL